MARMKPDAIGVLAHIANDFDVARRRGNQLSPGMAEVAIRELVVRGYVADSDLGLVEAQFRSWKSNVYLIAAGARMFHRQPRYVGELRASDESPRYGLRVVTDPEMVAAWTEHHQITERTFISPLENSERLAITGFVPTDEEHLPGASIHAPLEPTRRTLLPLAGSGLIEMSP